MRRLVRMIGLTCMLLAACRSDPSTAPPEVPTRPRGVAEHPDGYQFIAEDAVRAQTAGASAPRVIASEAGAPGDRITRVVEVPAESCALFIARGSDSVEDADLFAYGDDGTVLGTDEAPKKSASLIVCPPHPRHVYVVARVASGHGIVAVAIQTLSPESAEAVGEKVGARGRPGRAAVTAQAWPGLDETIAEHRRAIGGTWQDLRRTALPVDPRLVARLSAPIDAEQCIDVLVIPDDQVSHLDVTVLDEEGRIVGQAAPMGSKRSLILCSPASSTVTLEVRPHAGRGLAAVIVSRSVGDVEPDLRAHALRFDTAPTAPLDEAIDELEHRIDDLKLGEPSHTLKETARVGRRISTDLPFARGCNRLDVVAGKPTRGLSAWVWSDGGDLLASAVSGTGPTLFVCHPGGAARLDVEALAQGGPFAAVLRGGPEIETLINHPLAASRLLARLYATGAIVRVRDVGNPKTATFSSTHLTVHEAIVPVGRCLDVVAAVGAGATGVEIRLLDSQTNEEISLQRGTYSSTARACALDRPSTLELRAEIRVAAGSAEGLYAARMSTPAP